MKKFFSAIMATLLVCSFSYAQSAKEAARNRQAMSKLTRAELNEAAGRAAKKEARKLAKEGWLVSPGQLPLEKQLDRSYMMEYEYDEEGARKFITGQGQAVGSVYDAARMQAINNARVALAGMIETDITAVIESTLGNSQISNSEAASINEATQASKTLIANKLGRTIIATECYREVGNKNVEVAVRVAYNTKMALNAAKEVVKMKLAEKGKNLHEQVDKIWANFK